MQSFAKGPQDYLAIFRRRKWYFLIPAAIIFCAMFALAALWPPTYRSSATILIEEPDVPRDLVSSTITSYADQRLQVITQRVMSTQNLIEVINQAGIFQSVRDTTPINALVETLRQRINLELVSADVVDPRSGRPTEATIAFTLTFDNHQPELAQRVLSELVSLYLSENLRTRRKKAAETTEFLTSEANKFYELVNQLESDLAAFKEKYSGALPEQNALNVQLYESTERSLLEVNQRERALDERRIYLQSELAQINPYGSVVVDGQAVSTPAERLRALQTQFISLQGVYGKRHPDVLKLSREIEALKAEAGVGADPAELEAQLADANVKLAIARQKYADSHPDVVRLKRQIDGLKEGIEKAKNQPARPKPVRKPDNPAYIQIKAQLDAVESERRGLAVQREQLQKKIDDLQKRLYQAPQVEREYLLLQRDYESALASYREVKSKQTVAELGQALETEQKAEQFSLIEPPDLPLGPVSPNRRLILFLGLIFAVGVGGGSVATKEYMDQSVFGSKHLAAIAGVQPLIVLPYIKTEADRKKRWQILWLCVAVFVALVALVLYLIDTFYMPLDVFWLVLERRIDSFVSKIIGMGPG